MPSIYVSHFDIQATFVLNTCKYQIYSLMHERKPLGCGHVTRELVEQILR